MRLRRHEYLAWSQTKTSKELAVSEFALVHKAVGLRHLTFPVENTATELTLIEGAIGTYHFAFSVGNAVSKLALVHVAVG